jgi:hypothetical protein
VIAKIIVKTESSGIATGKVSRLSGCTVGGTAEGRAISTMVKT